MLIEIKNPDVLPLLQQLEALHLITVLGKENASQTGEKISNKYKGVFTKEDAQSFDECQKMREE